MDLLLADAEVPTREASSRAREWLERGSNWLLIFDNAEDPEVVRSYLPQCGSGRVLVTSLNPSWRQVGQVVEVVEFAEAEAEWFLHRRTG